jgi:hypothetical protein
MSFSHKSLPKKFSLIAENASKSKICIKIAGNEARMLGIIVTQEYYLHDTFYDNFGVLELESN